MGACQIFWIYDAVELSQSLSLVMGAAATVLMTWQERFGWRWSSFGYWVAVVSALLSLVFAGLCVTPDNHWFSWTGCLLLAIASIGLTQRQVLLAQVCDLGALLATLSQSYCNLLNSETSSAQAGIVLFPIVAIAQLLMYPRAGLMAVLRDTTVGGLSLWRILLTLIAITLPTGFGATLAFRSRLITAEGAMFLASLITVGLSGLLTWLYARSTDVLCHLPVHDPLTELPSRAAFLQEIELLLTQASLRYEQLAVIFLDLDRFKLINENYGHTTGDYLLKITTMRLLPLLGRFDLFARWGGDEFVIMLSHVPDEEYVRYKVQQIQTALKQDCHVADQKLHMTASVGIALFPQHGRDGNTLVKNAEMALDRAKKVGRDMHHFYQLMPNSSKSETLMLENYLHGAIGRNEFFLLYQPKFDLVSQRVFGVEALIRCDRPN
ncbi:MAG: diguanylate cyclase [Oscillatoriales cyanobacterium SM2_2_1]|nr:diguanylate cyclase [Oscillatoriales cyanobacterium SM2_2_1]